MKTIRAFAAMLLISSVSAFGQTDGKPFSNPGLMYGTDLGRYMQTLYRLGRFDDMVSFTSSETLEKYGRGNVRKYYENCGFGYRMRLVSMAPQGRYRILSYNANINATNRVLRLKAVVENDTAKVVLENMNIVTGL